MGTFTNKCSRSRPTRVSLNQFGRKRIFPPSTLNGSGWLLPPSSHVKASIGRGTEVRFVIPRCHTFELRMSTSPRFSGTRTPSR
jgi:hypothetical protein